MTEQQISEEVLRYLNDNSYNYAVLIDGEWGSGKTYFVTNSLSREIEKQEKTYEHPRPIKYISLYGCKTINDVQENIAWSFAEDAREKILNKAGWGKCGDTVSRNVLLSSEKIGNAIMKKLLPETSLYKIASDWLNLGAFIFIFDDLERCDCSLNEVFGFLNELVEHENTKVIIIANEKEISGVTKSQYLELQYLLTLDERIGWPIQEQNKFIKNSMKGNTIPLNEIKKRREMLFPNEDRNQEYKSIREKIIGVTLRYEPNISEIISEIIESASCDKEIKDLLRVRIKMFVSTMDYYHHHNLRTFQFFLSKVSYLLKYAFKIQLDDEYKKDIFNRIIDETFNLSIKFKTNYQLNEDEFRELRNEQNATSLLIKKYVEKGEFLMNSFEKDVSTMQEELKANVPMDDPYYLLYQQYYWHTQEWCEEKLEKIINKLQNNKYPVSFYVKIIIAVQRLLDLGFKQDYMRQIKNAMIANLSSMGEMDLLKNDLLTDDKEFARKIQIIITEINDVIIAHSEKVSYISMKEILKSEDWVDKLETYIKPNNMDLVRDVPVFSKADPGEWVDKLHKADPETIDAFRHWLFQAYPKKQARESYKQDASSIKEIKTRLEKLEETDLIKKASIRWLKSQFDQIIQCNEYV